MLDKRGRDIGEPIITLYRREATPQEMAAARTYQVEALKGIFTRVDGYPTRVNVQWESAEEGYYRQPLAPG